jgi:signal transduction histidine kinase
VIRVRSEDQDGRVLVSVSDTGCGMSPAFIQDQLFRPFQSTKKHGLGIGLFQSRAVVHAHGGGIHVASEPGQGTTFTVSLPVGPIQ